MWGCVGVGAGVGVGVVAGAGVGVAAKKCIEVQCKHVTVFLQTQSARLLLLPPKLRAWIGILCEGRVLKPFEFSFFIHKC